MRIAIINKVISQKGGGAERYAADLITTLVALGHEIHAYGTVIEDVPERVVRHPLTMPRKPGFCKILGFARNARKALLRDAPAFQYDVTYTLTQAYPCDLYFMGGGAHRHWLNIRMPNPAWRLLRCVLNPTHFAQMWLEDQIFKPENTGMILANSYLIKEHAIRYGHVAPERVAVVHNGVDRAVFHLAVREQHRDEVRKIIGLDERDLALLFVAHNWERKGLATVIRALGRLKEEGSRYHLIVVGKGDPEAYYKLAYECGVPLKRLTFFGKVPDPEKLYAGGDVFVLPTKYDPCAGVTAEAMACGLPVITSRDNGACELVREGETGFVLPSPDDDATLAAHLRTLCDDELRERMGRLAGEEIKPRTFEQVVRETVAVMEQIVRKRMENNMSHGHGNVSSSEKPAER